MMDIESPKGCQIEFVCRIKLSGVMYYTYENPEYVICMGHICSTFVRYIWRYYAYVNDVLYTNRM